MKDNFIITVTNNIEGCPIEKYLDSICANVIFDITTFSDTGSFFSNFFGNYSGSHKLELLYSEASKELKKKAVKLGANAIVGFSADFKKISGEGKPMFMFLTSGTACVVKYQSKGNQQEDLDTISQEALDTELKRRLIVKLINEGASIQADWREFLYEHPQKDILNRLLDIYVADCFSSYETDKEIIAFIKRHLTLLPKSDIIDDIYSRYPQNSKEIGTLIKACSLFSPSHILNIAKDNIHLAISLFDAKKDYYQKDDLTIMKQILNVLNLYQTQVKLKWSKVVY